MSTLSREVVGHVREILNAHGGSVMREQHAGYSLRYRVTLPMAEVQPCVMHELSSSGSSA